MNDNTFNLELGKSSLNGASLLPEFCQDGKEIS
jgi:hypothetical protein